MPKMKTNKSAAKRFSRTGTGKLVRMKGFKRHLLTNKNRKRKRSLGQKVPIFIGNVARVKRMLPYA